MGLRLRPGTRNGVRYFRDPLAPVSPAITGTRLRVTSRAMCAQPIASKAMMSNSEGTGTTRRLADLPRVIMTPRVARHEESSRSTQCSGHEESFQDAMTMAMNNQRQRYQGQRSE